MIFFSPLMYKYAQQGRKLASPGAGRQATHLPSSPSLPPVKASPALSSRLGFQFPTFTQPPEFAANCFPLLPAEQTNVRPYNSSAQEPTDWKRRRSPPLSFKFKLKVLGIKVMDANVAILTSAAVTVGEERQDKVIDVVRSSQCLDLYQTVVKSVLTTPSRN